jgi:hypothetical protein
MTDQSSGTSCSANGRVRGHPIVKVSSYISSLPALYVPLQEIIGVLSKLEGGGQDQVATGPFTRFSAR